MIKITQWLLGKISGAGLVDKSPSNARPRRPINTSDFRAVEIAPSIVCCAEAMRAGGKPYLLREAPRLPLYGCTMPTNCSCKFLKNADRRDADRRFFGATATNRWFAGIDSRTQHGRRSVEK